LAFVRAFEATGERCYLDAAVAAAKCLAWGQLASGGWTYNIEFDPSRNRNRYHHLDPQTTPRYERLRDVATFDDNTTQSATRLLMAVDKHVDDPTITKATQRALACFLTAQYKDGLWDGAWPQRYPPPKNYGAYPTFNDNTMSDCVRTMLVAAKQYDDPRYMDSVKRCIEFYLRSQLPAPQTAWAQQYDEALRPAWARKFEPPAVTGGESAGNMLLLLDMYIEFGDQRYLDAVGRAVNWYRRARIGGTEEQGVWARFYELGTNKPLYFTRTYELVYTDDDLPVHYSFKSNYGVDARIQYYEQIRDQGRDFHRARRDHVNTPAESAALAKRQSSAIRGIIRSQDDLGRWVTVVASKEQVRDGQGRIGYVTDEATRLHMMYSSDFIENMEQLATYITALQSSSAP
jgi:PelA/Pel-15E family pectate lyase